MELKEAGNALYLLGYTKQEIGGSEYLKLHGELGGSVPKVDPETNFKAYNKLLDAMDSGLISACHDCSEGGLAVAVAEMAFTGNLGVNLDMASVPVDVKLRDDIILFSESNGRLLIEVPADKTEEFEKAMEGSAVSCIGAIKTEQKLTVTKDGKPVFEESLEELMGAWKTPLEAKR
jgi:phosphoribosylformylglycinamidine synthase